MTGYRDIHKVLLIFDNVYPRGERLKIFGGTASGPECRMRIFGKIYKVVSGTERLKPVDCLDIMNIIGKNVVSGSVRRTLGMCIVDPDDTECINAKSELYGIADGFWQINPELTHRAMSNNSILFESKPDRAALHKLMELIRFTGESGFINAEEMRRRSAFAEGVNPCGEILLPDHGMCNLTTVNVAAFVRNGVLDWEKPTEAQRLSECAGMRMNISDMELDDWNRVQKKWLLTGCSPTGWRDMLNATGKSRRNC